MLGRKMLSLKKWWMLALVVTLALSLTSCSKKPRNNGLYSGSEIDCAGDDWSFYVALQAQGNYYYLVIEPYSLNQEGDFSQIAIAQGTFGVTAIDIDVLKTYTGMYSGRQIVVGPLDYSKLDGSWNLVMWQYGVNGITDLLSFLYSSGGKATSCPLYFE